MLYKTFFQWSTSFSKLCRGSFEKCRSVKFHYVLKWVVCVVYFIQEKRLVVGVSHNKSCAIRNIGYFALHSSKAFIVLHWIMETNVFLIQWVTKNTSSWFWNLCFSGISTEPLELQKIYFYLFASLSKELSDEKKSFQIRLQNQLIFAKTLFCQKKVSYWKKSAILKN